MFHVTQVCFAFCRRMEQGYTFFGLRNGRDCYCTPYYTAKAGNEGEMCTAPCDGDSNQMCGGENKSLIFEMHSCKNAEIHKKSADETGYQASSIARPSSVTSSAIGDTNLRQMEKCFRGMMRES